MRNVRRITVVAIFAVMAGSASAQLRQNAYEMVTTREEPNTSFGVGSYQRQHDFGHHRFVDKVIILDKGTGALWSWSERQQSVMYLGQIFPLVGTGSIAHIIEVNPEQKSP